MPLAIAQVQARSLHWLHRLRSLPASWPGLLTLRWLMASIAFLLVFAAPGFREADFYWHLKTGELIAQTGAVPAADPFSYTYAGRPWVAHEWLAQLIFYQLYALGGFDALRVLPATAAAVTLLLMHTIARRLAGSDRASALATIGFFMPLMPFFTLRPQIFTYVCFTTYLLVLVDFKYFRSVRRLWWLPLLMLVWVNLHGAFMLGIGLLVAFGASEWLQGQRVQRRRAQPLGLYWGFALLTVAATVINPQGLRILIYPFELLGMEASRGLIEEWASPSFHDLLPRLVLAGMFAWIIAVAHARRRPDLTELLLPLMMIAAGLLSQRHLPLASIVLLAGFCVMWRRLRPLTRVMQTSASPSSTSAPSTRSAPSGLQSLLMMLPSRLTGRHAAESVTQPLSSAQTGTIHLLLLAALVAAFRIGWLPVEKEATAMQRVPVGAVDYLVRNGVHGRMLNDYDLGGYLIYRLWPERKVFIDGRADLYGDRFLKAYLTTYYGGEGWQQLPERYAIDYAVLARGAPLRQLLLASGDFRETYVDAQHVVLLRDVPRFRYLIERDASER